MSVIDPILFMFHVHFRCGWQHFISDRGFDPWLNYSWNCCCCCYSDGMLSVSIVPPAVDEKTLVKDGDILTCIADGHPETVQYEWIDQDRSETTVGPQYTITGCRQRRDAPIQLTCFASISGVAGKNHTGNITVSAICRHSHSSWISLVTTTVCWWFVNRLTWIAITRVTSCNNVYWIHSCSSTERSWSGGNPTDAYSQV